MKKHHSDAFRHEKYFEKQPQSHPEIDLKTIKCLGWKFELKKILDRNWVYIKRGYTFWHMKTLIINIATHLPVGQSKKE